MRAAPITPEEAQKLWNEYRSGDMYALANIMQSYYVDLFHWGLRLNPEHEFIKDCIQDVFVKLWKIHETVNSVANIRAYLMMVLKSRIIKELSKKHVTHQFGLTNDYAFSVEFSSDLRMIHEEHEIYKTRKLERILNGLSERQREVIYLKYYQALSYDEIAEMMQLNRQSVYNLIQKSLGNLRKQYDLS